MSDTHLTDTPFSRLDLEPELIENLNRIGYERCTPIQAEALPLLLSGTDVAGQAQTGTGKTIAFLLATINYLMTVPPSAERAQRHPLALIVAPTRELAVQIHKDAEQLVAGLPFRLGLVYGGVDYDKQRQELADGVDILIGTPGRLIDYYKQRVYSLRLLQVVVLDEADRMFDLGFIKDIRFLFNRMPPPQERLSMLFSATLSFRVNELAYEHMNNPVQVEIEPDQVTVDKVRQVVYHVSNDDKVALLVGLLRELQPPRSMVFVNTKWEGERVAGYLAGNGISVGLMTGDVPQRKRLKLLRQFQESEVSVLVATDVAARGLHIPDVTHVFNYDLPQDPEDYVHRIGRTARAGAEGDAISFGCETWVYSLPEIEEYIGNPIPMENVDPAWLVELRPPVQVVENDGQGRDRRPGQQRRKKNPGGKSRSRGNSGRRQGNRSDNGGAQAGGNRSGNNGNAVDANSGGHSHSADDGGQPKARNPRRRRPRRRKPQGQNSARSPGGGQG